VFNLIAFQLGKQKNSPNIELRKEQQQVLVEIIRIIDINLYECFPNLTRTKFEDTFNGVIHKESQK
jgi:hypothetical protein